MVIVDIVVGSIVNVPNNHTEEGMKHKLAHYLGKYTSHLETGSGRGHSYAVYVCDTPGCGKMTDSEPRNQFLIDTLYFIFWPLKNDLKDKLVDKIVERLKI